MARGETLHLDVIANLLEAHRLHPGELLVLRAKAKLTIVEEQRFRAQLDAALDGTGVRGLLVPHHLEVSAWAPPES
jgi:hypothetical protein